MTDAVSPAPRAPRLDVRPMDESTREPIVVASQSAWDRPRTDAYLQWRYRDCPVLEVRAAMAGDECVAMMCAFQRKYAGTAGEVPLLEPFDWYATERWRALGAGLRVVKRFMSEERPLLALGGTAAAQQLFARLGWRAVTTAERHVLPLRGAFMRARGHGAVTAALFDLVGRHYWTPRAVRRSALEMQRVPCFDPTLFSVVDRQRGFALLPVPDAKTSEWLAAAPPEMGRYEFFVFSVRGTRVGWASTRTYWSKGKRAAEIQEFFLADEARVHTEAAIRSLATHLAAAAPAAISINTSCRRVQSALRRVRFRHDEDATVFAWGLDALLPALAPILVTGGHADRSIFPVPTAAEARLATAHGAPSSPR